MVVVDGLPLDNKRSARFVPTTPSTQFTLGYSGAGPNALAIAILLEAGLSKREQELLGMQPEFLNTFIQPLQHDAGFRLDIDIDGWIAARSSAGVSTAGDRRFTDSEQRLLHNRLSQLEAAVAKIAIATP